MLWLWTLALCLPLALRADEPSNSSEQTKRFSEAEEAFADTMLKENETERMWVTNSSNTLSNWSGETITTPPGVTRNSSSASEERMPKATVTISSVNGTCNVTLYCSNTGGGENITYTWSYAYDSRILSEQETLRITQKPKNGSLNYTCTVRNMKSEDSSTVSLISHCHDAPLQQKRSSATSHVKYWAPPAIVLVLLLFLLCMYRRKRGRASRSRTVSINESSDSDSEDCHVAEQTAQLDPLPEEDSGQLQAWKEIPEDSLQTTEMFTTENDEENLDTRQEPLNQA
ncbi:SLAM family member 5-like [Sphaerodactylus townsendi]|uniref:SLAM family member 5-like n=1 Tax=Sphaerodactylus townsendi TaxID=933632 RepID=UPI002026CABB|nr:SLAM family member 5-like [Sphaerodactylus townsendi]